LHFTIILGKEIILFAVNDLHKKIITTANPHKSVVTIFSRGIFIFGGGNKRLRNVTKMYCQCQICHKRRKKECLGKFKLSLN
jgi:hypothetical protein